MNVKNSSTYSKKRISQIIQPYLSQSRFPHFWLAFQLLLGGTFDKRKLATEYYSDQKKVLEIGCSVGNVSAAFTKYNNLNFVGIDTDEIAISNARKRFRNLKNFIFNSYDLREMSKTNQTFDYILFAGILHHVNDGDAMELLRNAVPLLDPEGIIIISEPLPAHESDSWLIRLYHNLFEQGSWVREKKDIETLVNNVGGLLIRSSQERTVSPFLFNWPKVARFCLLVATSKPSDH